MSNPQIIAVIGVLCLLIWFNTTLKRPESEQQINFNSQVASLIVKARNPTLSPDTTTPTELIVASKTGNFRWVFITPHSDAQENEKVLRLLSLLNESKIFNRSRSSGADYQITCTIDSKSYSTSFYKEDMLNNAPLGNFMKLAQFYSKKR